MKKYKKQFYILGIFWMVSFQNIFAQSNYIFHHLETSKGLSNNNVKAALRDSYGFLWIGTESGLNRYDGYGFKVYTMHAGVPNALRTNDIFGLQEDGFGNIWVDLGYNNYMVYKRDKDNFISDTNQFLLNLGIKSDPNPKIFVDKNRNLWVFNKKNIFYYNVRKKRISIFKLRKPITEKISIADKNEFIYVIQSNSGACWQLNKNSGALTSIVLPDFVKQNTVNVFNTIYVDGNNGLWLYSSKSEQVFYKKNSIENWKRLELTSKLKTKTNKILCIAENQPGQIWIGTDHKGLFIYDKEKDVFKNIVYNPWIETGLASNHVQYLYKDNNETIWIGYNKKGLSFYHESFRNFINFRHPEFSDISAIMQDYKGNIWLGTDGNGLFVKEKKSETVRKLPIPDIPIVSMLEDSKKRIWIGTFQNGLFCYDSGKMTQYTTKNSKLTSNDIWNLKKDRFDNIWIGPLTGKIQVLPADSDDFNSLMTPFDDIVSVQDMYYDGGDKMYAAIGLGLLVIDIINKNKIVYNSNKRESQTFLLNQVSNVYKDKRGIVWLGNNNGLTIWNQKKDTLYYFNKGQGLCDNSIRGITEDNFNNIWVTTSNGLSILTVTPTSNEDFTFSSKNFFTKDGLMDNYFNNRTVCKLQNGDIIFGNVKGYTLLNPNKLVEKNRPTAKIIFTGLTVGNQDIEVDSLYNGHKLLKRPMELTSKLTFRHDDKLIILQFTTTDLLNADKVKYLYKIEGFNTEWIPIQENKIALSALPPGDYKLLIKASNSDGVWSNNPTVLKISVTPPFYLSVWAFVIYALIIIVALLYLSHRSQVRNRKKIEEHRLKMVREKERQISEMKLKFFTNISHDLRTPLTLIITPLQVLLNDTMEENMRKKLSVIYKNATQLLSLINSLLDFRKLDVGLDRLNLKAGDIVNFIKDIYASFSVYAEERTINLSFTSELESLSMLFDKDKIQKILTNLLSNAFKYTPDGGSIKIYISKQGTNVCVKVSDSGLGINDEDKIHVFERFYQAQQRQDETGSGIGLHIVSEYVNLHGGTITVKDNFPHGSVFTFKLPVREIVEEKQAFLNTKSVDVRAEHIENIEIISVKPVLLFVDDNKDFCDFMADNLKAEYFVVTANNGQEAIEKLNEYDVTIIVSDVMMPIMDGIELCKQVKNNIYWSHIPVILLTARTAEEYQIEGLELGADDYITKPFNFDLLRLRIQKFIEWTKKSHAIFSQKMDVNPAEITITSLDEVFIDKAIKIVEENISDAEFSVEALGVDLGLTRGHLYKKIMIITGKSPSEFIRTIRLKRGRQLLEKSQLQISEIAYEVGFNSPKRFSKYFRDEFGLSPTEYLKGYLLQ